MPRLCDLRVDGKPVEHLTTEIVYAEVVKAGRPFATIDEFTAFCGGELLLMFDEYLFALRKNGHRVEWAGLPGTP